jgi:hypothetical protein
MSILGSVEFLKEPTVQNINDVNLEQLSKDLWMADQNTVISSSNMNITNMTLAADVIILVRILLKRKIYQ